MIGLIHFISSVNNIIFDTFFSNTHILLSEIYASPPYSRPISKAVDQTVSIREYQRNCY